MSSSNLHHANVFGDDSDSAFLFADRKLRSLPLYPHLMPFFSSLLLFQFFIFSFFFGCLRFYLINQPQMLPMATNCNYQYKNSATINFDNLKQRTSNKLRYLKEIGIALLPEEVVLVLLHQGSCSMTHTQSFPRSCSPLRGWPLSGERPTPLIPEGPQTTPHCLWRSNENSGKLSPQYLYNMIHSKSMRFISNMNIMYIINLNSFIFIKTMHVV